MVCHAPGFSWLAYGRGNWPAVHPAFHPAFQKAFQKACRTVRPHSVSISRAGNREQRADTFPDRPCPCSVLRPILHSLPGAAGCSPHPGQHGPQGCSRRLPSRVQCPSPTARTRAGSGRAAAARSRRTRAKKELRPDLRADRLRGTLGYPGALGPGAGGDPGERPLGGRLPDNHPGNDLELCPVPDPPTD